MICADQAEGLRRMLEGSSHPAQAVPDAPADINRSGGAVHERSMGSLNRQETEPDRLVLVVSPAPESILNAYRRLKREQQRDEAPRVGVLVTGVGDPLQARIIHRNLDRAATRFLGISVAFLGWEKRAALPLPQYGGAALQGEY